MADRLYSRPAAGGAECLADSLEKPLLDDRTYRVIQLPNKLEALLVHDPDTDKASAAMDVDVGAFADDEDMPGMAHAIEHLLFMGTEKYPGENEYSSYLTKYGGYANAFTAATSTNYYFELNASAKSNSPASSAATSMANSRENLLTTTDKTTSPLHGALERFSQFFIHPLFSKDTLDRELRAVDSENKKNLQSDMWRMYQLNKSTSRQEHPFHKFSTGNYKVLHDDPIERGVDIREEFIKFYQKHYSANRMKLVVLGQESLDELQEWVETLFADIVNKDLPKMRWDGIPMYGPDQLGTQIFAKPVMEQRKLDIYFAYPDEDDLFESKPGHYLSHLIGHEGPGSILTYLKAKGWANSLSCGSGSVCPGSATFHVDVALTEEGLKHYKDVTKVVFQYIAMLKEEPPQQWINDEISKLAEVRFRFKQKMPASRTTSGYAGIMQHPYPRDRLLSAQSVMTKFDPEAIKRGLAHLVPDNFRLTIVSQDFPGDWDRKEKWYGTEHRIERLPQSFMDDLWAAYKSSPSQRPAELHLPGKNEFVPERLDVEKKEGVEPTMAPKLIRNDGNVRTWYKRDDRFWVPKANVEVCLRSPAVNLTPLTFVTMKMYLELVDDVLSDYVYDAELAGLAYNVDKHARGLAIGVFGFNDKMSVLLEKVLTAMRDLEVKQDRFDIIKERVLRSYRNFEYMDPFRQISTYSQWLVSQKGWAHQQLLDALPSVTADDVRSFFPQVLRQMHIEVLVHGNMHKEDALRVSDVVENTLRPKRLPQSEWTFTRSVVLPPGSDYRYEKQIKNPDNVNHCLEYNLFIGEQKTRDLAVKTRLLGAMTREPFFDKLRTKESLGYVVQSYALPMVTYTALRFVVQSEKNCEYLESRVDAFLDGYEKELQDMPEDEFNSHKVGLINQRLAKLKNLSEETGRFWHHIMSEEFDFESTLRDVEIIETLTKDEMLEFYRSYILPASPTRAKACVYLIAAAAPADIAAKLTPAEKKEKLLAKTVELLEQVGLPTNAADLSKHVEESDVTSGNVDKILANVGAYLKDAAALTAEQVTQIIAQGKLALDGLLPSIGITVAPENGVNGTSKELTNGATNGTTNGHVVPKKSKAIIIDDVKAFKASLQLSQGPQPVKALCEFEELEPKL